MDQKVAVVTGGGRRLGRAIAETLAGAGYDLFLTYLESERGAHETAEAARAAGRRAHAFRADLRAPGEAEAVAAAATGLFAGVDLLVNNSAIFRQTPIEAVDQESWVVDFRVNLMSPLFLSRALWPALRERRGSIVNVGSLGGRLVYRRHLVYSLTKAALAHLTRGMARRFAPEVRVNSVAPGGVEFAPSEPGAALPPLDRIPLGRFADPREVAALVLFLAEDAGYVTGQTIPIDGGRSIG